MLESIGDADDSDITVTRQPVVDRQVLIIVLLSQICSLYDVTPKTFVLNVLRLHEKGILDSASIDVLRNLDLLPSQVWIFKFIYCFC